MGLLETDTKQNEKYETVSTYIYCWSTDVRTILMFITRQTLYAAVNSNKKVQQSNKV